MSQKKKILIIQQNLNGGGAEKVLIDILRNFDYSKYDVTLVLLYCVGVYFEQIPSNVEVLHVFDKEVPLYIRLLSKLKLYLIKHWMQKRTLLNVINNRYFDTIISFMEGPSSIFHSYILDRAIKNITWVHLNLKVQNWCAPFFDSYVKQRNIYTKMDDIIFVSEGAKIAFEELFNIYNGKVIYNLIDFEEINKKSEDFVVPKKKFTICNVGRLALQKRQDRLIEVVENLTMKGYNIECWILGTGNEFSKISSLIKNKDLQDVVLLKGFQKNPYPYVKASDIFLLTSDTEGYPLVVCESLCLGKPIVSTKITGPSEILDGDYGILCDSSVESIACEIERMINDTDLLLHYQKKALERSQMFSIQNTMNQIYTIL